MPTIEPRNPTYAGPSYETRYWRNWTIFLSAVCAILILAIAVLLNMACQDSMTHWNLSYVLWKKGMRRYDSSTVLQGIFHDHDFRESLLGISETEFQQRFPNTFYPMKYPSANAPPGQHRLIEGYANSLRPDGRDLGWIAVFENNKLTEFDYHKGA